MQVRSTALHFSHTQQHSCPTVDALHRLVRLICTDLFDECINHVLHLPVYCFVSGEVRLNLVCFVFVFGGVLLLVVVAQA